MAKRVKSTQTAKAKPAQPKQHNLRFYWIKQEHEFYDTYKLKHASSVKDISDSELSDADRKQNNRALIKYIYNRLLVESCTHDGRLRYDDDTPYTPEGLAIQFDLPTRMVEFALESLIKAKLVAVEDDSTYVMIDFKKYVGTTTESTLRSQKSRALNGNRPQNTSKTPQEASEEVETDKDTVPEAKPQEPVSDAPAYRPPSDTKPPDLKTVIGIATSGFQMMGGKPIPKEFVEEWYARMVLAEWKDTTGASCIRNWRIKLGYAWSDEQRRDKAKLKEAEEAEKKRKEEEEREFRWNKMRLAECDD